MVTLCMRGDSEDKLSNCKASGPNSVTYLCQTPIFEWCVVRCGSKNGPKRHMFKRDWTMLSKNVNCSTAQ